MSQNWEQTDAVATALGRLREPHYEKKKATILALVHARISGVSSETVFNREKYPDVCSRTAYHNKWKKEPVFAGVLAEVTRIARHWNNSAAARKLTEAADRLMTLAPLAVGKLALGLNSSDETERRLNAVAILDRAGLSPAARAKVEHGGTIEHTGADGGKIEHNHSIDEATAGSIFDILASVGAIQSVTGDAEAE